MKSKMVWMDDCISSLGFIQNFHSMAWWEGTFLQLHDYKTRSRVSNVCNSTGFTAVNDIVKHSADTLAIFLFQPDGGNACLWESAVKSKS